MNKNLIKIKTLDIIGFEAWYKEYIKKTGNRIFCFIIKSEVKEEFNEVYINERSIITNQWIFR